MAQEERNKDLEAAKPSPATPAAMPRSAGELLAQQNLPIEFLERAKKVSEALRQQPGEIPWPQPEGTLPPPIAGFEEAPVEQWPPIPSEPFLVEPSIPLQIAEKLPRTGTFLVANSNDPHPIDRISIRLGHVYVPGVGQLGQDPPHGEKCEDTGKTEEIEGRKYKILKVGAKSGDTLSHLVQRCCGQPGGPSLWKLIAEKNGLKNVGTEKEPNYAIQPCSTYLIYCPQDAEKPTKQPEPAKPSELEQQNIADKKKMIANLEELQKGYQEQFDKEKDLDKKNETQRKLEDVKTRLIGWRKKLDEELSPPKEKKTGMSVPGGWQRAIVATRIGTTAQGLNKRSAYGFYTDEDKFVALPCKGQKGKWVEIVLSDGTRAIVPVGDLGPWNETDCYWEKGDRPRSETGEKDDFGRPYKNKAGIDFSENLWKQLGLGDKGMTTCDWRMIDPPKDGLAEVTTKDGAKKHKNRGP